MMEMLSTKTNNHYLTVAMAQGTFFLNALAAFLLIALLCLCPMASCNYATLRRLRISGNPTPYELGLAQGQAFGSIISDTIQEDTFLTGHLRPFVQNTNAGKVSFESLKEINSAVFPDIYDELRGLADGAKVSLDDLLILSFRIELDTASKYNSTNPDEISKQLLDCSDILLPGMIGHNEDAGRASLAQTAYLLETDNFTAYTYPSFLSGMAWSFNRYGLILTANAVFPKALFIRGLARYWLSRDALHATSIDDAILRISGKKYGVKTAYGFSMNLGDLQTGATLNAEVLPMSHSVTVTKCDTYLFHFNMYMYSQNVDQYLDESSVHRWARAKQLPIPHDAQSIVEILGDTEDSEYPIFRNEAGSDEAATIATAVFDMKARTCQVWPGTNPKNSSSILTLSLDFA